MRTITEEQRKEILKRWDEEEPLKLIAHAVGVSVQCASRVALRSGRPSRHPHRRALAAIRLRPVVFAELKRVARETKTTPEVIAREAIAAYLGHVQ